ncbi:hypothetical protein [Photobacterium frigidiphilum]|uniref:hypothetical protein n=1 Tax=Photobacterium frigidiphilum TaxID=264736 RepID=UPI0011B20346|nr:hypothetical protein [Photobacterium frigidiphilum]
MNNIYISRTPSSLDDAVDSSCLSGCNIHCTFSITRITSPSFIRRMMIKNGITKITFTDGNTLNTPSPQQTD